jgi:hypothetical protein
MARSADATARSRPRRNPGRAGYLSGASGLSYPTGRVFTVFPFGPDGNDHEALFRFLGRLPEPVRFAGIELQAPILFLPNVFEPEFCWHPVGLYEQHGGEESGFMRGVDGKTVGRYASTVL